MAKSTWLGPVMAYHSAYGGESLRGNAASALRRVRAALRRCAQSDLPVQATLTIYDAQTAALQDATRAGSPGPDDVAAALRARLGQIHPLVAVAEAAFGPGTASRFGVGAAGDLWSTTWTIAVPRTPDPDQEATFAATWQAMAAFVEAHGDAAPIAVSWPRRDEKAHDPALELALHFAPRWSELDSDVPLPEAPHEDLRHNRIIVQLHNRSVGILDIQVPMASADARFAAWERGLCAALGVELVATRWRLEWVSERGFCDGHKHDQARYRRADWTDQGRSDAAPRGPWDAALDALVAPRIKGPSAGDLRRQLAKQPLGPVVFGLVERMAALKGAPLERGQFALSELLEQAADRSDAAAALSWLMQHPPASGQLRAIAYGFAPAAGDSWYIEQVEEWLAAKKIATAAWLFLEEVSIYQERADNPAARAQVFVRCLRLLRDKGPGGRRGTLSNCLSYCDDGGAWATWLLELASPPEGHDDGDPYETWAHSRLSRWQARDRVRAPEAAALIAALPAVPRLGEPNFTDRPVPVVIRYDDAQRARLEELELAYLGLDEAPG